MANRHLYLWSLCIVASLSACKQNDDASQGASNNRATAQGTPALHSFQPEGKWTTKCIPGSGTSGTIAYQFSGSAYQLTLTTYLDAACTTASQQELQTGTWADQGTAEPGGHKVDLTLNTWGRTMLTDQAANTASTSSLCGVSAWTKATAVSILGKTCQGSEYPMAGVVNKIIVKIDGSTFSTSAGPKDSATGYPSAYTSNASDNLTKSQ